MKMSAVLMQQHQSSPFFDFGDLMYKVNTIIFFYSSCVFVLRICLVEVVHRNDNFSEGVWAINQVVLAESNQKIN